MVGGILASLIILLGILSSPLFAIHSLQAKSTQNLSRGQIVKASGLQVGQPLWIIWRHDQQLSKVANANNDLIRQITVTTHWWDVRLEAKEYRQAGNLVRDGKYYQVIENGRILKTPLAHPTAGYPVYSGFKHDATFAMVIQQYAGLSKDIKRGISEIDLSPTKANPQRLHLFMNDGNEVYASPDSFRAKMKYYPEIAAQMNGKGIINLEVGAYSYPFPQHKSKAKAKHGTTNDRAQTRR